MMSTAIVFPWGFRDTSLITFQIETSHNIYKLFFYISSNIFDYFVNTKFMNLVNFKMKTDIKLIGEKKVKFS